MKRHLSLWQSCSRRLAHSPKSVSRDRLRRADRSRAPGVPPLPMKCDQPVITSAMSPFRHSRPDGRFPPDPEVRATFDG